MSKQEIKRIICLYGGPGSGKSTTCAGLFYLLKSHGFDAEMNREYVKNWVWEERNIQNGDQTYFFSKMARNERIFMKNNLQFIITDSPLVLTHYYGLRYDKFEQLSNTSLVMLKHHHVACKELGYKVEHYFIARKKEYNPNGRLQTLKEAQQIDDELKGFLTDLGITYKTVGEGELDASHEIYQDLLKLT